MKLISFFLIFLFYSFGAYSDNDADFEQWKKEFKIYALANGVSEETYLKTIPNVKFLPKVIEYDRFQPEFYEDTKTYISKRTSEAKVKKGLEFYKNNKVLIDEIATKYEVDKELLLALMGIETNFGTYVGIMDIL